MKVTAETLSQSGTNAGTSWDRDWGRWKLRYCYQLIKTHHLTRFAIKHPSNPLFSWSKRPCDTSCVRCVVNEPSGPVMMGDGTQM